MTTTMKHTPEPWTVRAYRIIGQPDAHEYEPTIATFDRHASAARAAACVNALAGVADPGAALTELREAYGAVVGWEEQRRALRIDPDGDMSAEMVVTQHLNAARERLYRAVSALTPKN